MRKLYFWVIVIAGAVLPYENMLSSTEHNLWMEDYAKACKIAQDEGKPLLLAFVGSDWCPWSQKLAREILGSSVFLDAIKENTVLVWVDFPEYVSLSEGTKSQNMALKNSFDVQELPTLVLANPTGKEIAKFGYVPLAPQEMAEQLNTALASYAQLKNEMSSSRFANMAIEEVELLYKKAVDLGREEEKKALLAAGLKADKGVFFLMRQYEQLLEHAKIKDPQVQRLRRQIMQKDPGNHKEAHLELAIVEFQALSKNLKSKDNPEKAVVPLIEYVRNFGVKDMKNNWRVEMMIAQFFYSKNRLQEAVAHAKNSYEFAPEECRVEVGQTLDFLCAKAHVSRK